MRKIIAGLMLALCAVSGWSVDYFGFTTASGTTQDGVSGLAFCNGTASTFTCPGTGSQNVVELSAYVKSNGGTPGSIRLAIYNSDRSTKIAEGTAAVSVSSTTAGWVGHLSQSDITPNPVQLTGGTNYVLVLAVNGADVVVHYNNSGVGSAGKYFENTTWAANGFPSSITGGSDNQYVRSIRCGVTASTSTCEKPIISRFNTSICTVGVFFDKTNSISNADSVTYGTLPAGLTGVKTGATIGRIYGTPTTVTSKMGILLTAKSCNGDSITTDYDTLTVVDTTTIINADTNIYVSQSGDGDGSGKDASNSHPLTWLNTSGNWGAGQGKVSFGDTVRLCGTITSPITLHGSGQAGNPIVVRFENNAKMTKAHWNNTSTNNAAIYSNGKSYITINGGSNGIIESTDNGTAGLKNNQLDNYGVYSIGGMHVSVCSLTVKNFYERTPNSTDSLKIGSTQINAVSLVFTAPTSYLNVYDNNLEGAAAHISVNFATDSNINISNNNMHRYGIAVGINSNGANTNCKYLNIFKNTMVDTAYEWDGAPAIHKNAIHIYAVAANAQIDSPKIYSNFAKSKWGTHSTSLIFVEQLVIGPKIYNNVLVASDAVSGGNGLIVCKAILGDAFIANNSLKYDESSAGLVGILLNTLYENNTGSVIYNNNFYNLYIPINLGSSTDTTLVSNCDYNNYYNAGGFQIKGLGGSGISYASWKSRMGFDTHSGTSKPDIDSLTMYQRSTDTSLIGKATALNSYFDKDFRDTIRPVGINWDIGAYEFYSTGSGPTITAQPQAQTVTAGQTATYSVTATGTGMLAYQWHGQSGAIGGATSSSYTTGTTTSADNGKKYMVKVTDDNGTTVSDSALLTVLYAPTITADPENATKITGETATFSITATGNLAPTYQWYKNGQPIGSATNNSYTTPALVFGDNGNTYYCIATNATGSAQSGTATLTVNQKPYIDTQPQNQTVNDFASVTFTVAATGTSPITYQWYTIPRGDIVGATGASYTFTAAYADNGNQYAVVCHNAIGDSVSDTVTLTVNAIAPVVSGPANVKKPIGKPAVFAVSAYGTGSLSYQWQVKAVGGSFEDIVGETNPTYTIAAIALEDAGKLFKCNVTNATGTTASREALLTIGSTETSAGSYKNDAYKNMVRKSYKNKAYK